MALPVKYAEPTAERKAEAVPRALLHLPDASGDPPSRPGLLPICGMALEPVLVNAEAEPDAERIDMKRRFWIGLTLTAPVFALEMGGHLIGLDHFISRSTSSWIQFALATPVVFGPGSRSSGPAGRR